MPESWLQQILTDEVSNKYYIEHGSAKANHMSPGSVALVRLGASKERVKKFVDWYAGYKVEPKDDPKFKDQYLDDEEDLSDPSSLPLGSRTKYFAILDYIEGQISANGGDYKKAVAEHFPKISDGFGRTLLHSLIQTGYGVAADCAKTVAEGLAYGYHSYYSAYIGDPDANNTRDIGSFGQGTMDLLDVVEKLRKDEAYKKGMEDGSNREELQNVCALVRPILGQFHGCCKELQTYVDSLKLPDVLDLHDLDVDALATWIVDLAMSLYAASEVKNDFCLLHGVTGAWALKQVLPLIADQKQEILRAARTYCMNLLAIYIARGSQPVNLALITEQNEKINEKIWDEIKEELLTRQCDEHYYKFVQVAYDMWKLNRKQANLYWACVRLCLTNPIYVSDEHRFPLDDRNSDTMTMDLARKLDLA